MTTVRIAGRRHERLMEVPVRCTFFERLVRLVAVLNEDDVMAPRPRGLDQAAGMGHKPLRRGNGRAAHAVEGAALDVDDKEGGAWHGVRGFGAVTEGGSAQPA